MRIPFALLLVALVAGCANRQPTLSEMRIQARRTADAATSPALPFCLHIKYANEFKYVFTQNDAQAWVTDGSCEADGPRRAVAELVVRWRYRYDSFGSKACTAADTCSLSEQNFGEGKTLSCVSGSARDGGYTAIASTDGYACP